MIVLVFPPLPKEGLTYFPRWDKIDSLNDAFLSIVEKTKKEGNYYEDTTKIR